MIQRYNTILLNSKSEDLSEEEQAYIKTLFPNLSIDSKEGKYNIKFDRAKHRFKISTDNTTYYENTDIDASNQLNDKMAQHSMIRNNPISEKSLFPDEILFDEYLLDIKPQSEEETYNEYYSRLSSYFNGLQAIMQGKKVEISENGISVEEAEYKGNNFSDNSLLQSAIEATMESTNNTTINTQLTQITTEVNQPNKEVQQEVK